MSQNLSIRQIEAAAKKAVEEAMAPLTKQLAAKKKAPAKKAAPPKAEPEASPAKDQANKLRKFFWGNDE